MANRKISYTERDFEGLRQDLINFTRQYYPDLIDNFNDGIDFSQHMREPEFVGLMNLLICIDFH